MKAVNIKIKTKNNSYSIVIGNNLIKNLMKVIKRNSLDFNRCLIIVDKNVPKKFLNQIKLSLPNKDKSIYFFNSSEINKNFKNVNKIINILLKKNFHRNDCLISVGGGITGDVSGFAASIYKRGLKFINIPSTLLAQVDSSIGGKTGINSKYGKNSIGSFYQPSLVISDTNFLKTLPKREIICGYAEILKHSLISSKKFFLFLNKHGNQILNLKNLYIQKAVHKSCLIKKQIVELDENEKNLRKILNFGHTFAHAYEATVKFSKKLNHGEAVLLGINSAINFSLMNKILQIKDYKLIKNHLIKLNLPNKINKYFSKKNINKILSYMHKDKKNKNKKINLVMINKIGKVNYNSYFENKVIRKFLNIELSN
jgi:3-dehydroquinate synthase/shikimate kinase/3-dehydroquinate synthase